MTARSVTPNMLVEDVAQTVRYYIETLGFSYVMGVSGAQELHLEYDAQVPLSFAIVASGTVQLMFQQIERFREEVDPQATLQEGATPVVLYIEIDAVDSYYRKIASKVEVLTEPRNTFYGMREFYIRDCNGTILTFAQKLGVA